MSLFELILLGIGLAMDCFAVSFSKGLAARRIIPEGMIPMAIAFGLFQAIMPLGGYFAGTHFASYLSGIAPWIALILLGFIGGKMIFEYFSDKDGAEHEDADFAVGTILILAVATSIDALATGLLFVGDPARLYIAVIIIGAASFLFSSLGSVLGALLGNRFKFPAELIGGIILVCIGLKIWLEGLGLLSL